VAHAAYGTAPTPYGKKDMNPADINNITCDQFTAMPDAEQRAFVINALASVDLDIAKALKQQSEQVGKGAKAFGCQ
jgi:hypothetical protein